MRVSILSLTSLSEIPAEFFDHADPIFQPGQAAVEVSGVPELGKHQAEIVDFLSKYQQDISHAKQMGADVCLQCGHSTESSEEITRGMMGNAQVRRLLFELQLEIVTTKVGEHRS